MRQFMPRKIYYEPEVRKYPLGCSLLEKYEAMGIDAEEIENHNRIPQLRKLPDTELVRLKKYLILGVRKSLRLIPNKLSADFIVPFTSSGCSAMCLYCYLLCTFFKGSYLRVFVNREEIMKTICRKAAHLTSSTVFELGSNSDLILENTVTGNLPWVVEQFARLPNATATLATKFHMVDDLLDLNHQGHTQFRISVNPQEIIRQVEIGTSTLKERITAANKLYQAGYRVGINIAPVILLEEWKDLYTGMFRTLNQGLEEGLKQQAFVEIIFMTYGQANRIINPAALPGTIDLFDKQLMRPKGRGKYCYRPEVREKAEGFILEQIRCHLPRASISYIV
ncbi:MAG TPA: spore photoproduct lyase [Syntrophomonadaceae bacterium]|nr:spore photoproduct lyase [Syntrophomonadaceae bacterium]